MRPTIKEFLVATVLLWHAPCIMGEEIDWAQFRGVGEDGMTELISAADELAGEASFFSRNWTERYFDRASDIQLIQEQLQGDFVQIHAKAAKLHFALISVLSYAGEGEFKVPLQDDDSLKGIHFLAAQLMQFSGVKTDFLQEAVACDSIPDLKSGVLGFKAEFSRTTDRFREVIAQWERQTRVSTDDGDEPPMSQVCGTLNELEYCQESTRTIWSLAAMAEGNRCSSLGLSEPSAAQFNFGAFDEMKRYRTFRDILDGKHLIRGRFLEPDNGDPFGCRLGARRTIVKRKIVYYDLDLSATKEFDYEIHNQVCLSGHGGQHTYWGVETFGPPDLVYNDVPATFADHYICVRAP